MTPTIIGIFMAVVFVLLAGFDLYLSHCDKIEGNTFSARFRALGRWWPPARALMILAIGLVLGHLFWTPQDVNDVNGQKCLPSQLAPITAAGPADAAPSSSTDAGITPNL
jgi:hypothetical protein